MKKEIVFKIYIIEKNQETINVSEREEIFFSVQWMFQTNIFKILFVLKKIGMNYIKSYERSITPIIKLLINIYFKYKKNSGKNNEPFYQKQIEINNLNNGKLKNKNLNL